MSIAAAYLALKEVSYICISVMLNGETSNLDAHFKAEDPRRYSRTSMARTPLGPWKFVRAMGSSSK